MTSGVVEGGQPRAAAAAAGACKSARSGSSDSGQSSLVSSLGSLSLVQGGAGQLSASSLGVASSFSSEALAECMSVGTPGAGRHLCACGPLAPDSLAGGAMADDRRQVPAPTATSQQRAESLSERRARWFGAPAGPGELRELGERGEPGEPRQEPDDLAARCEIRRQERALPEADDKRRRRGQPAGASSGFVDKLVAHMIKRSSRALAQTPAALRNEQPGARDEGQQQPQQQVGRRAARGSEPTQSGGGVGAGIHLLNDLSRRLVRRCAAAKTKAQVHFGGRPASESGAAGGRGGATSDTSGEPAFGRRAASQSPLSRVAEQQQQRRLQRQPDDDSCHRLRARRPDRHQQQVGSSEKHAKLASGRHQQAQLVSQRTHLTAANQRVTMEAPVEHQPANSAHRQRQQQHHLASSSNLNASNSTLNTTATPSNGCLFESCSSADLADELAAGSSGGRPDGLAPGPARLQPDACHRDQERRASGQQLAKAPTVAAKPAKASSPDANGPAKIKSASSSNKLLSMATASYGSMRKLSTKEKSKRHKDAERIEKLHLLVSYLRSGSSQPVVNPVALEADEIELAERYKLHMVLRDDLLRDNDKDHATAPTADSGATSHHPQLLDNHNSKQASCAQSLGAPGATGATLAPTPTTTRTASSQFGATSHSTGSSSSSMHQAHSTSGGHSIIPHIGAVSWALRHSISDPGNQFESSPAFDHHHHLGRRHHHHHHLHDHLHHHRHHHHHHHHHDHPLLHNHDLHDLHHLHHNGHHNQNRAEQHDDHNDCTQCGSGAASSSKSSSLGAANASNNGQQQQQQAKKQHPSINQSPKLFYIDDLELPIHSTASPVTPASSVNNVSCGSFTSQPAKPVANGAIPTLVTTATTITASSSHSGQPSAWTNPQNLATWIDNEVNSLVHDLEAKSSQLNINKEKSAKMGKRRWLSVSGGGRRSSSGAHST